jgi:membrane protein required for colicin V production
MVNTMDIVLGTFLVGGVFTGWRSGLVFQLIGLLMLIVGFVAGAYLRGPVGAFIGTIWTTLPDSYAEMLGYAVAFIVVFTVGNLVVGRLYGKFELAGVSEMADKLMGATLGGVVAALLASAAIAILDTFYGQPNQLGKTAEGIFILQYFHDGLKASWVADVLRATTVPIMLAVLGPIIPKDIGLPFLK